MNTELSTVSQPESTELSLGNKSGFEHMQRVANLFAASQLVPAAFQGNLPNCVIALEISNRIGASPFAVIQNLNIIHGRPSFSSQYMIAAINTCGRFLPLRYHLEGEGDERTCIAWTVEKAVAKLFGDKLGKLITLPLARAQGDVPYLEGAPVSIAMAKAEGWFGKNGSKWKTMPEMMLRYRAATFFARLYAPEITMGMRPDDEVIDIEADVVTTEAPTTAPAAEEQPKLTGTRKRSGVAKAAEKPAEIVVEAEPAKPAAAPVLNTPAAPAPVVDNAPPPPPAAPAPAVEPQQPAAPASAPAPAPAAPTPAKEEPQPEAPEIPERKVRKITAEITRAVQRTPEAKAPYCEVELSGKDYTGPAFFLSTLDKLPDVGVVAEIEIEARESAKKPGTFAQFILRAEAIA